jgi:hypothetical protein
VARRGQTSHGAEDPDKTAVLDCRTGVHAESRFVGSIPQKHAVSALCIVPTEAAMRRIAFAIAILWAVAAAADSLQEWKTPDGKIYFGDRPPEGSAAVKTVRKPIGKVAATNPGPAAAPASQDYVWRDNSPCQELTFTNVKEEPFEGIARRIMRGTVTHNGNKVVKNVKVCGAAVCQEIRGGDVMSNGDKADFYLDIQSAVPSALRIECSIREPAA